MLRLFPRQLGLRWSVCAHGEPDEFVGQAAAVEVDDLRLKVAQFAERTVQPFVVRMSPT